MKRWTSVLAALLAFVLLLAAGQSVAAKELEECYHCNRTGQYRCQTCGNTAVFLVKNKKE